MQVLTPWPLLCRGLTQIPHLANSPLLAGLLRLVPAALALALASPGLRWIAAPGC